MKKVRITVKRITTYPDLMEEYENKISHTCDMKIGDTFIYNGKKPGGFCDSAWDTISSYVIGLSNGEEDYFDGWMKNKKSVMLSCNDGFRPVSFYIEALDEDID